RCDRAGLCPCSLDSDFLKLLSTGLLPALGNEFLSFVRRLISPSGVGRPGTPTCQLSVWRRGDASDHRLRLRSRMQRRGWSDSVAASGGSRSQVRRYRSARQKADFLPAFAVKETTSHTLIKMLPFRRRTPADGSHPARFVFGGRSFELEQHRIIDQF